LSYGFLGKDDVEKGVKLADAAIAVVQVGVLAILVLARVVDELGHENRVILDANTVAKSFFSRQELEVDTLHTLPYGFHLGSIEANDKACG
jgi:hypothetical protein